MGQISVASMFFDCRRHFPLGWHDIHFKHSSDTGDEDYWLIIAHLIVPFSQKAEVEKKKKRNYSKPAWQNRNRIITTLADIQLAILAGSISSKHNVFPLFCIRDAELVISRCAVRLWSAKESERRRWKPRSPGFSPLRRSDLKWTARMWANWKDFSRTLCSSVYTPENKPRVTTCQNQFAMPASFKIVSLAA